MRRGRHLAQSRLDRWVRYRQWRSQALLLRRLLLHERRAESRSKSKQHSRLQTVALGWLPYRFHPSLLGS
ncbi:Uncharacterised protein [Vibrio cholerae]|nr:Uncharacterised protein [Vibrio cholerae]